MSTIVNARDVILQAASPRFLGLQLGSNVSVPIAQVPGLSTAIAGTKSVELNGSSQVFQIPKTGSISPTNISITATYHNVTGTPTFVLVSGTMSVTPALTADVFTFTPAQMTSDTVTFRLSLVDTGVTYTDDFTVIKVREGADGIVGFLTNENMTLTTDSAGNVTTYTGASGSFKVFQGSTDVTTACTFAVQANPDSLTTTIIGSGGSAGNFSVSAGFSAGLTLTSITYRATFGSLTIDKVLTLSKARAGTAGSSGTSGSRGSMTFYVAIAGSTFSDSVATSTASTGVGAGGPIYGDVVTQYNNSANFSLSKYWNGSAWVVINAVVDGNLLVKGSVGAQALVVNNGSGNNLWWDASYQDIAQWGAVSAYGGLPLQATVSDGVASQYVMRNAANVQCGLCFANRVPVTIGKQYRISVKARKSSTANGTLYVRVDTGTGPASAFGTGTAISLEAQAVTTSWATYASTWTATTPYVGVMLILNEHSGSPTGYMEAQDIRIEEMMDSALIVTGGVTADRIDTKNLTIKDGSGIVLFGSGTLLDWPNVATANRPRLIEAVSRGFLNSTSPKSAGFYVDGTQIRAAGDWWTIVLLNADLSTYDSYTWGTSSGTPAAASTWLNAYLAAGLNKIVVVYTDDHPTGNISTAIITSLLQCGASNAGLGSSSFLTTFRASYSLIGRLNSPAGSGIEVLSRVTSGYAIASATVQGGGVTGGQKDLSIDASNVSTYIANAALGTAQVGVLTAGNLTVSAISNTVNGSTSSGGRVEITTNRVEVYDASNALRVRLGLL